MSSEQIFFELVEKLGECNMSKFHIINVTHPIYWADGERNYRIYHSDGYCINCSKELIDDEGNFGYEFNSSRFDGFETIECEQAIKLIL